MATRKAKIGMNEIKALKPGDIVWDTAVSGFGARRQQGSAIAYVLKYRTAEGRQRWYTIGQHDQPWKPESARKRAKELLGDVVKEKDPAAERREQRNAQTVAELCDQYLKDAEAGHERRRDGRPKKASTLAIDKGRIAHHIKPLLGSLAVRAVTSQDVESFLHRIAEGRVKATVKTKPRGVSRVSGGQTAANRSVGLLGAIFSYAQRHGMRSDNPVRGVRKFPDNIRRRRLSDAEYELLGRGLKKAQDAKIWQPAVAWGRFLAFTGWRKSEAKFLRWADLDMARRTAFLGDTKTGRSMRPLSHAACGVLAEMVAFRTNDDAFVFPATRGGGAVDKGFWNRIKKLGELPADVSPHVLRHSFASVGSDLGYSEATIAALIGHKGRTMTSRYISSADAVLLAAADKIANHIGKLMGERKEADVVELHAVAQ